MRIRPFYSPDVAPSLPSTPTPEVKEEQEEVKEAEIQEEVQEVREEVDDTLANYGQQLLERLDAIYERLERLDREGTGRIDQTVPDAPVSVTPEETEVSPAPTHWYFRKFGR